ncbi:hypothetical protein AS203_11635 [Hoylesella enoeca]|uniref:Uncharacterized protein n=1 Tax=Hoylesella enoeca TaxID=76123 RepID=A0A0S2KNL8_9BACT|nr:hypothetical protein AS203_11635 [Hoylesella enoeca]
MIEPQAKNKRTHKINMSHAKKMINYHLSILNWSESIFHQALVGVQLMLDCMLFKYQLQRD